VLVYLYQNRRYQPIAHYPEAYSLLLEGTDNQARTKANPTTAPITIFVHPHLVRKNAEPSTVFERGDIITVSATMTYERGVSK
jgi:hypothetical protein